MSKKEKEEKRYYTVREVATILNLSTVTVRGMIKKGTIAAVSFGERSLRIDRELFESYIEEREKKNPYRERKGVKK